jgi:ATP-dependent DNA ligase
MKQISKDNDAQWQSNTPAEKQIKRGPTSHRIVKPAYVEPMQCKAVTALPEDGAWTFEIKFDGYRCIAVKQGADVTLFSRNHKKLNDRFPGIVEALGEMPGDFAVDGEIVALDAHGRPAFQLLQNSQSAKPPIFFYAFDLLNFEGEELLRTPIEQRREKLSELFMTPTDRGCLRCFRPRPAKCSKLCKSSAWRVSSESASDQSMNLASGAARGSNAGRIANRNSSLVATCRARADSIR